MTLDLAKNFAKANLLSGYASGTTTVVLVAGGGAKFPPPPFNAIWYNSTTYRTPADDPFVEIVRVIDITGETLTLIRAQEGTANSDHNIARKTYTLIAGLTAKLISDINALGVVGPKGDTGVVGPASVVPGPTGNQGATGVKGDTGAASMVPGPSGDDGNQGDTGVHGDTGTSGATGVQGQQGIQGDSENDMPYSKRVDFVTDDEFYKGEAAVGSVESATVWRIRKVNVAVDSDITEIWAEGTAAFDKQWTGRAAYIYS